MRDHRISGLAIIVLLIGIGQGCDGDVIGTVADGSSSCTEGASRCAGNTVEVCKAGNLGLAAWVADTICLGTEQCVESGGSASCVDSCTNGSKDGTETDVDCGGACAPCANKKACLVDEDCTNNSCVNQVCEECKAKSFSCLGNLLRQCKDDNSGWTTVATCDPTIGEGCNASTQQCEVFTPIGSPDVTGTYYLFGYFEKDLSEFKGGYDVDSYEDLIYVNNGGKLDVYKVTLLDTDGDGKMEPNQHPDNKDATGPKEERKLAYLKTYENVTLGTGSKAEIYAEQDRIYFLKDNATKTTDIHEFIFATGQTTLVHAGNIRLTCLGYDEQAKHWYGAFNSAIRRVYSFYPDGGGWALEFLYPPLAGQHLDGLEIVVDPKAKVSYVYVSDMTSDFLTQYYRDAVTGQWVQKNVFEYKEQENQHVEGMGFGAFQHFWMTSGKALYEVGGGDLQKYVGIE